MNRFERNNQISRTFCLHTGLGQISSGVRRCRVKCTALVGQLILANLIEKQPNIFRASSALYTLPALCLANAIVRWFEYSFCAPYYAWKVTTPGTHTKQEHGIICGWEFLPDHRNIVGQATYIYHLLTVASDLHVDHCCPKNTARQLKHINMLSFTRRHIGRNDRFPNKMIAFPTEKRVKAQKTRELHNPHCI